MHLALTLLLRAVRLWWRELLFLLVLNFAWLLAQLTIVLGPPATAALFVIAGRVADGDLVGPADVWHALRENFARAWVWGLVQWVVYGILAFNLWYYRGESGAVALALRYTWTLLAIVWFGLNLYYWPLNLAQAEHGLPLTLANCAKMALLNPAFTLAFTLLALVVITAGVASGVLLGAVLAVWLALWSTLAVRELLRVAGVE
jgi:uncharacterized membrane protein YesL